MKAIYTVTASDKSGIVVYRSHPTARNEQEAIEVAKMYAGIIRRKVTWAAEFRRDAD